jgi:hypothetical protein
VSPLVVLIGLALCFKSEVQKGFLGFSFGQLRIYRPHNQALNQSINQSIDRSINQSSKQAIIQSSKQSFNQVIKQS